MISNSLVRAATRIRKRYAESFATRPHVRMTAVDGYRAPTALAYSLSDALREARTIACAEDMGLTCAFETSDLEWDGDCPAPRHVLDCIVRDSEGTIVDSLSCIGVDSLDDPYLDTVRAEVYAQAIDNIEAETDRLTTIEASELASRATYAGPAPEVHT